MITIIRSSKGKVEEFKITDKNIINLGLILMLSIPKTASANTINQALQPLINILQDLAEPISYGFMIKGFLQVMAGDDHAGQKTIKSAIGGFLGIQFIPKIFAIIKSVKF